MKCERCQIEDVVVKITRIQNAKVVEHRLCHSCASEISPYHANIHSEKVVSIDELIKQLVGSQPPSEPEDGARPESPNETICPSCGLQLSLYKATFMVGCADCYDSFGQAIASDIQRIQGTLTHVEAGPPPQQGVQDVQNRLEAMRAELQECLACEDFPRAAWLRDEIKRTMDNLKAAQKGGGHQP